MKRVLKFAAAVALTGALAVAMATPSQARSGRNAALIGGLAAGAILGAAAASAANSGYYYGPGYYEPDYVYEPGYAYESGPVYVAPSYSHRYRRGYNEPACAIDMGYGRYNYSSC